jgi:hypothetical protein
MIQFLYEFLSDRLCTDMTFVIKGYLVVGDVIINKIKNTAEWDEDDILRRRNRWRKYSL